MTYTVSITSQGQISIPIQIRRKLGLEKNKTAFVTEKDGKILVEPVKDFLDLGGSLHHKAIKNKTIDQIMQLEEQGIEEGLIEREKRFIKQMKKK